MRGSLKVIALPSSNCNHSKFFVSITFLGGLNGVGGENKEVCHFNLSTFFFTSI